MKKTFIGYLLVLIPLSSYSCLQAEIGDNVLEKEYQTIRMENDSLRPTRNGHSGMTMKNSHVTMERMMVRLKVSIQTVRGVFTF